MSRQRLGQHFLIKGSVLERIAAAVCPEPCDVVVEIGPGRGALTAKLLDRAKRVVAIEVDPYLVEHLRNKFGASGRLEVVHADVLEADLAQWNGAPIAGNLPYYITSPILEKVTRLRFPRAVFLIQKEVADRLAAQPGSRAYGFLTVQTAVYAKTRVLFDVKPGAFHPPPKVDSAVVLLEPREADPEIASPEDFLRFVGAAFRQKRKTLRNNLEPLYPAGSWPEAGLRAEQLSLEQFREMYQRVPKAASERHDNCTPPRHEDIPGGDGSDRVHRVLK
jgi:16S rRNA (adenine1518-N6/adenine1519-N6)-dimethyltransferase